MTRTSRCLSIVISLLLANQAAALDATAARLIMFSSPTCGPCQQMKPLLRQMESAGYQVQTVDVSQRPDLAQRHRIKRWPTFIVLIGDQVHARAEGGRSLRDLEKMVQTATARAASQAAQRSPGDAQFVGGTQNPLPGVDPLQPKSGRIVDMQPAGMDPPRRPAASSALLTSTVRISVEDQAGHSRGTGTIVDARSGEALILTCGHIFRESQGRGQITVTLFTAGPQGAIKQTETSGALIDYDLDRDLGLISIRPNVAVHAAQIAASDNSQPGTPVSTVGCNRGADPTVMQTRITALNRYEGHPNIEAAGAPIEGRSGGGLFNAAGQLIGVCFAADPTGDEGLYVALASIHEKLDQQRLTMIYRNPPATSSVADVSPVSKPWPDPVLPPAEATAALDGPIAFRGQEPEAAFAPSAQQVLPPATFDGAGVPPVATTPAVQPPQSFAQPTQPVAPLPRVDSPRTTEPAASPARPSPRLSAMEQATLEELRRRGVDSEVICIIRPRTPDAKSEVINLSKVSPAFVEALVNGEASATTVR